MTSILHGAVKRGTAKKLKNLDVPLNGLNIKNKINILIVISMDLNIKFMIIGVSYRQEVPKTLGKFETGSKKILIIYLKTLLIFMKNKI